VRQTALAPPRPSDALSHPSNSLDIDMQKITNGKFTRNVLISILAQAISLGVGILLNFAIPKYAEALYPAWQKYVLYVGYVGVLHFGLLDGIVLRYAQYDYDELDKARVRSQFRWLLCFTGTLTLLASLFSLIVLEGESKWVTILVAVGIVTKNVVTYSLYAFQITNRVSKYASQVMLQKLIYGILVAVLLLCRVDNFVWFCIADLAGDVFSVLIMLRFNRKLCFGHAIGLTDSWRELKANVSAGFFLMLANWSAMLLLSGAKLFAQWHWSDNVFALVSFSFSVMNLFLTFVTALSVVIFPTLKRLDMEALPSVYKQTRSVLTLVLVAVMALYFPGCWLLHRWLPNFSTSLTYLGIVLPIVIYSTKVSLLTNNYLKVYRRERILLLINLISVVLGGVAFAISTFLLESVVLLLICMVLVIMFNSILSEIVVMKYIQVHFVKEFIVEAAMAVSFMVIAYFAANVWLGLLLYLCVLAVYCLINHKTVTYLFTLLLSKKKADGTKS
jgi:O-antigen/teichoic acid export membrane protein